MGASLYELILALHIMAVVVAFGVTFAYPIMFSVAARVQPASLPLLHRIEYTTERVLINPALVVVVGAGVYLASKGHFWSDFFVQWGLGAAIAIGALVGAVLIPTAKRAEQVAARDLAAAAAAAPATKAGEAPAGAVLMSDEYRGLVQRSQIVGSALSVLVLVTILFMALNVSA
ncbi:MAG TPA: hypothetical protein VL979_06605 [Solirubrobacteraceae bacterium]|nr:hypothetical protein [Solirubrobacteraceae bacterium]